jgi:hypothetical protein
VDPISFSHLVFHSAPQGDVPAIATLTRQLKGLAPEFRQLVVRSALRDQALPSLPEQQALIANGKLPVVWLNLGFEAGLMVTYPGTAFSPAYDPRLRPWYTLAQGRTEAVWGTPYADSQGQGLLLSCSLPLYTYAHQFMGVGSLDLLLDYVTAHWLPMAHPAIRSATLLDAEGRVVTEVRGGKVVPPTIQGDILTLPRYAQTAVWEQARQQASGHLETPDSLFLFARIKTLNWVYVVEADPSQVFGRGGASGLGK